MTEQAPALDPPSLAAQTLTDYNAWRERLLLEPPDISIEAYLAHLEFEAWKNRPKEIEA